MRFWQRRAAPARTGPPEPVAAPGGQQRPVKPAAVPDTNLYKVDCLICGQALGVVTGLRAAELLLLHMFGDRGHGSPARCYLRQGQDFSMLPVSGSDAPLELPQGLTG